MVVQVVDEPRKPKRAGAGARDVPAHPLAKAVQAAKDGLGRRDLASDPPGVLADGGEGAEKSLDPGPRVALRSKGFQVGSAEVAHARRACRAADEPLRNDARGKQVARLAQAGVERPPVNGVVGVHEVREVGTHPVEQSREVRRRGTPPLELVQELGHVVLAHRLARAERELGKHRRDRLAATQHPLRVRLHPSGANRSGVEGEERVGPPARDARAQVLEAVVVAQEDREVVQQHLKALGLDPAAGERGQPYGRPQRGGKLLVVSPPRWRGHARRRHSPPGLGIEPAKRVDVGRKQRGELFSHALRVLGSPHGRKRAAGAGRELPALREQALGGVDSFREVLLPLDGLRELAAHAHWPCPPRELLVAADLLA